ncbi:hypothetical protein KVT40_002417 [Elsinoe batatas]|uniref:Uncharacterized protein n=1 Tax=Elsinoe batatas TaxID=2601811 RepID=A0A8K0L9Y0_9PEZI|nr:hypothetical protein KVT40_002417 [Elsinoe batatas]
MGVCKEWKHLIETSSNIQKHLFLLPDKRPRSLQKAFCNLCNATPTSWCLDCPPTAGIINDEKTVTTYSTWLAPGALASKDPEEVTWDRYTISKPKTKVLVHRRLLGDPWRKMFVTQPPRQEVSGSFTISSSVVEDPDGPFDEMDWRLDPNVSTDEMSWRVRNDAGVTVGDVVDECWVYFNMMTFDRPNAFIRSIEVSTGTVTDTDGAMINPDNEDMERFEGKGMLWYHIEEKNMEPVPDSWQLKAPRGVAKGKYPLPVKDSVYVEETNIEEPFIVELFAEGARIEEPSIGDPTMEAKPTPSRIFSPGLLESAKNGKPLSMALHCCRRFYSSSLIIVLVSWISSSAHLTA